MSISRMLQKYDALGPLGVRATVTLDQDFTGSAQLTAWLRKSFGVGALTLNLVTAQTTRTADQLKLVGTASLLHLTDVPVTLLARDQSGELVVTVDIQLPAGWSFSDSFAELPASGTSFLPGLALRLPEPNLLNQLSLGQSRLVFSSVAAVDELTGCALVRGLNFVGELYLMGALYWLGMILQDDSPTLLHGPLSEIRTAYDPLAFLGVRLAAPLPLELATLGPLTIDKAQVYVKTGLTAQQRDRVVSQTQEPGIYLLADTTFGGRPLSLVGKYDLSTGDDEISLYGRFADFAIAGFGAASQQVGVEGFDSTLPDDFPPPQGLSLTEFGVSFGLGSREVSSLLLGVGTQISWELIPGVMTLQEVGVTFRVLAPFSSGRKIGTTITGLLAFKTFSLAAYASFPDYEIGAGLPIGETLPLGEVLSSFLPHAGDLPALSVTRLQLRAASKKKSFYFSAEIHDLLSIPVGKTTFVISGLILQVDYKHLGSRSAVITAQMGIADSVMILGGQIDNGLTLGGSLENFDLKKFWNLVVDEPLPAELPDILLQTVAVQVTPHTGAFQLSGSAIIAWDHLTNGEPLTTTVQFSFSRTVSGSAGSQVSAISANLSLEGRGNVDIASGFSLQGFSFQFSYATGRGWSLGGSANTTLFDNNLTLQAAYATTQSVGSTAAASRKLTLQSIARPAIKLIDLVDIASYSFAQLDLMIERRAGADGKPQTFFDLRLASTLQVGALFTLGGFLGISRLADGSAALTFKPDASCATFPIKFPTGEGVGMTVQVFELGFRKPSPAAGWGFTGTTTIGFTGLGGIGAVLPSKLTANLTITKGDARISALNVTEPLDIPLPTISGKRLGTAVVQLTEVGVSLRPQLGLIVEAGLGFPAELNTYLGSNLFRVYQKGNPLTLARTRFTIGGTGVAMQFVSSPFASASAVVVNGESWFDIDFGAYGALSLKMPTFVYDGVSQYFEAGGGVKITRPLAIPMSPLKSFLGACGMSDMAAIFPAKLPVTGVKLVDNSGELKVDELVKFLQQVGAIPQEVITVLKKTAKVLDRIPSGFKQYLNIEVPDQLTFKFGFSPAGRVSLALLAPSKPIRVLFPCVVPSYMPLPGLCGLELRKLTVGTLMAGAVLFGEIDATLDMFDLPSLALSLMLPRDEDFPLPTSNQLQRRVILDDVFCVIPVSAGVPVPLPLFYDEIGFEYLGIEGLGVQAHLGFPKPPLGGLPAFFQAMGAFTSNPKALLDPNTAPGGVDLVLSFHDEFLQAPEYLGGGVLGTKGKTIKVGAWKYIATMMNFSKTFSINDFIGAIPIENRVGSTAYRFAFLKFDADWLLTTPSEFRKGAFAQLKLSASDCNDFIAVLPAVASSSGAPVKADEKGLVTFVRGKASLGFVTLEAAFGLAASSALGFNTGFRIAGKIGSVIDLELEGAVMVNAPLASATGSPAQALSPSSTAVEKGQALALNGKDSWMEIPADKSLMLREYTIELWIRAAEKQSDGWVQVFGLDTQKDGHQRNFYLELNSQGGYYHHRFKDSASGNSGAPDTPGGSVKWGQWQHVALTNDGRTAKTFLDGKEVASGPVNGELVLFQEPVFVGKMPGNNARFFKGDIAELRIFKHARSASEITATLYEVLQGDEPDLVSLYRMEQSSGNRALDVCGRNHGKIQNGRFIDTDLLLLEGRRFNGSSDYLEIADSESLRLTTYTVETWFKPRNDNNAEWIGVVGKRGRNYALYLHRDGFAHHRFHDGAGTNSGAPNTPNGTIVWNQWNHVAIVNDGKTAMTYVNGVKQAEGGVSGTLVVHNEKLQIGRNPDGGNDQFFQGEIAEVRVWSDVRTPDEIRGGLRRRIDSKEDHLVSLYRLGEAKDDTLIDLCGRNAGRIYPSRATTPAALQHDGLLFSGNGDYALIPKSDKFATKQYSIEVWIRPDKDPGNSWQAIWEGSGKSIKLFINNKGLVSHRFYSVSEVGGQKVEKLNAVNTDEGVVRFGEWNHLAITNDGTTYTTIVNGVQKSQGKVLGTLINDAAAINLGRSEEAAASYFRGSIDDIRYWGVARTLAQITQGMTQPMTGAETGVIAYYDMDHTAGSQLIDRGASKLHGAVTGAEWALAKAPSDQEKAVIQIYGHTHLRVLGREVMRADLRLVDSEFWFSGQLDLFPADWPLRVYGHVEGLVSKQRFYLSGETENQLFGVVLAKSRLYVANSELRLEGRWFGAYTMLDITWAKNEPVFSGTVRWSASPDLDFGAIWIAGVKVADNVCLSIDMNLDLAVTIAKQGFAATVNATFKINGQGFTLRFDIQVAPAQLNDVFNWVKQKIIDAPEKYLAFLFSDAATWLKNVGSDIIGFAQDSGEAVGTALKIGFGASKESAVALMKGAGYEAAQVGEALGKSYKLAAQESAALLKGANYAANEVGSALQSVFRSTPEDAAKALKNIGYEAKEVSAVLKSTFGKSAEECDKILKGAGYAVDVVKDVAKDVGNTVTKGAKSVEKGAKKILKRIHF